MKSGDVLSGKYRLEQEIGKGAMGAVWSAFDHSSNRRVALKAILPQAREQLSHDLRQRLMREARACRKLSHRHIVQMFDVGETPEGEPFIILELLQGQTLGDRLKEKRRIEPGLAARIAAEVASGLAVAHAAQVIHRDLKPANIFLHREEGMPEDLFVSKILDFGVCKTLDSVDSVATQTGTAVGSPAYMSPEQVGMRKDLDHRTDFWSLGIMLFEMLTGARPFSGSVHEVIRNILMTPVPPPSSKVRDVPSELDAIVARCTAGRREERFANAMELSNALFTVALTARPMTRKATFTGIGAPPSMALSPDQDRPSAIPAPLSISMPSASSGSVPQGIDESELAATLPFQSRMLMDKRPSAPEAARRPSAPTGTEIIQPEETLGSSAPEWNRNEMQQALAAHRQSSASLEGYAPEQVAGGNTQAVTDSQMPPLQPSPGMDPLGTTSGAGALSQRSSGIPSTSGTLVATDPAISTGRRKKTKTLLFAVTAAGIVAVLGLIGLIAVVSVGQISEVDGSQSVNEVKQGGALVVPTASAEAAPAVTSAPAVVTAATTVEPAPPATPSPPETAAPAVTVQAPVTGAPSPSPMVPPANQALAPKPMYQAPAPKPTTQAPAPKPTSQAPSNIFDFPSKPAAQQTTPAPAPCKKWVGEGLTKRCVQK